MQFKFFQKPENYQEYSEIKEEVIRELLRQVKHSHNVALGVTAASALMTLGGVGLLYMNKVSEATLTTSGGVLATITSVQFAQQSKKELQEVMDKLDKE